MPPLVVDKDRAASEDPLTRLETFSNLNAVVQLEAKLDQSPFEHQRLQFDPDGCVVTVA